MSEYKNRHPNDIGEPHDMGLSLDDEATGMEEQIGIATRITLSRLSPGGTHATPGRPSAPASTAGPSGPEKEAGNVPFRANSAPLLMPCNTPLLITTSSGPSFTKPAGGPVGRSEGPVLLHSRKDTVPTPFNLGMNNCYGE